MRKSVHTWEYEQLRGLLVKMRRGAGLSLRELAARLGVAHMWVARVESGERRIDLIEFGWFCKACGIDAGEAMAELGKAPSPALARSPGGGGKKVRPASLPQKPLGSLALRGKRPARKAKGVRRGR